MTSYVTNNICIYIIYNTHIHIYICIYTYIYVYMCIKIFISYSGEKITPLEAIHALGHKVCPSALLPQNNCTDNREGTMFSWF